MEFSPTLVTVLLAIVAAAPGIYSVVAQMRKTRVDAASLLIENLQQERKELRQEIVDLKAERRELWADIRRLEKLLDECS